MATYDAAKRPRPTAILHLLPRAAQVEYALAVMRDHSVRAIDGRVPEGHIDCIRVAYRYGPDDEHGRPRIVVTTYPAEQIFQAEKS